MLIKIAGAALAGLLVVASASMAEEAHQLSRGQTVYVPVYSEVLHGNLDSSGNPSRMPLSAMLSIRNTDPAHRIDINSVRYYDGGGKLLRAFLGQPKQLEPLQSTEMFVEHKDMTGGTGASFLVVWSSGAPVNPPVIEAVHAYFFGNQSTAFISPGRAITSTGK